MNDTLPINSIKADLLAALEDQRLILLSAPPGAGKSTVLPLWLLALKKYQQEKIYLLQPRRIAAKNVAHYLAKQLNENVGESVGYRLRNEVCVSANTRLEVITEGILTRIMQNDPELAGCSLIIFDEFHERSSQADLAFALARDIQQGLRDDLTIMLMSATMANDQLLKVLPEACLLSCAGRSYPISYSYQAPNNIRFWREHALSVIKQQLTTQAVTKEQGSILVFLPSSGDIRYLAEQLNEVLPNNFSLFALYGDLPLAEQQKAIEPCAEGHYKVVLATNIAETSLTIEGINLVIDSGFENIALFDQNTLTNQLKQQAICKASAIQRAGRAGRLSAGHCIRLYSEDDFQRRPEQSISDIQQTDLTNILIEVANWGVTELAALPFLELPSDKKQQEAWQTLQALTIVDQQHKLTTHGQAIAELSCHPRFAHMIVMAKQLAEKLAQPALVSVACLLTALLEERDIFSREQGQDNCDISLRLNFLLNTPQQGKHQRLFAQAKQLAKQANVPFTVKLNSEYCGLLLALAYPERIAKNRDGKGSFLAANGKGLQVSLNDPLAAEPYIVVAYSSLHNNQLIVRLAAAVVIEQLIAEQIVTVQQQAVLTFDAQNDKIMAQKQTTLGAIILKSEPDKNLLTRELVTNLWCQQVVKNGLAWLNWQADDLLLLNRLRWLTCYQPALNFPDFSEHALLDNLNAWFAPFVGEITHKQKLNQLCLTDMLLTILDYAQQKLLEQAAPAYYVGPTGRRCAISYGAEKSPKIALPMQEVYGLADSPTVGLAQSGEVISVILELLSPAGRPIQITQNLALFWQGSYAEVKKEMKGRYPKHFWPDDPANAKPTNKTKNRMSLGQRD